MDYPMAQVNRPMGMTVPTQSETLMSLSADVLNIISEIEAKLRIQVPEVEDKLGSDAPLSIVMSSLRCSRNKLGNILIELGKI